MNPALFIPTYVASRHQRDNGNPLSTYDHTTPINQAGELPRLLESLQNVADVGQIFVLVASEPSMAQAAISKVTAQVAKYPDMHIAVIGAAEASLVQQRMEQLGVGKHPREIGLVGYSAIRNLGLVIAQTLGFDAVIFLDDDEIVDDPDFMHKAVYGLGKLTRQGTPILAKTGFFLNEQGSYLAEGKSKWYNHFWQQGRAFNEWMGQAMHGPRLSRSNYAAGGVLAIHKEAFKRLAFDPFIPRGEDLDYVLNLRMYGSEMWFDNQWRLRHLPPETTSEGTRFRQDIYRWLYEFRKLEYSRTQIDLLQIPAASLEPYPGPFIQSGVGRRIGTTARLRALASSDKANYLKAAKSARADAATYAERNCGKYFQFQYVWPELMQRIENDAALTNALVQSIMQRSQKVEIEHTAGAGLDPGATGEIRLNMTE